MWCAIGNLSLFLHTAVPLELVKNLRGYVAQELNIVYGENGRL